MPIGLPSQVPDPKSACTPLSRPIEATIAAEFDATGSLSRRRLIAKELVNTGQLAALASVGVCSGGPVTMASAAAMMIEATAVRTDHMLTYRRVAARP